MAKKRVKFIVKKGFCPVGYVADFDEDAADALLKEGVVELIDTPAPAPETEIPSREELLDSPAYMKSYSSKKES